MPRFILCVLALLGLPMASPAAFHLTVDTTAKEFWFSGSETATGFEWGTTESTFVWVYSNGNDKERLTVTPAFSSAEGSFAAFFFAGIDTAPLELAISLSYRGLTTITADDSVKFSYTPFSALVQSALEQNARDQTSLWTLRGTGISEVTTSAVPEPSTYALLGLAAAVVIFRLVRPACS